MTSSEPAPDGELAHVFHRSVEDGQRRLRRSWPSLLATGAVGGIDVGVGVLAYLLVRDAGGGPLLAALAFGIGFVALVLARSELFTENFLVPVTTVAARAASPWALLRLWGGTLATNLVGGWVMMATVVVALPEVHGEALAAGAKPGTAGIGAASFASAVLAGAVITLMTWMERGTDSAPAKILAALSAGFLLGAGGLLHAVVGSLEMFAALQVGAPFGYADWLGMLGWSTLGNMVGGVGLVTLLRLVQVGRTTLQEEQPSPPAGHDTVDSPKRHVLTSNR